MYPCLLQCQAIVVGMLSAVVAIVMVSITQHKFELSHTLLLCSCSIITSSIASLLLGKQEISKVDRRLQTKQKFMSSVLFQVLSQRQLLLCLGVSKSIQTMLPRPSLPVSVISHRWHCYPGLLLNSTVQGVNNVHMSSIGL